MGFFIRLIWGDELDGALRPLVAVQTIGALAGTMLVPFAGVWALEHLGASQTELSLAFLCGAVGAFLAGYVAGHLSDHLGRRRIILASLGALVLLPLVFMAVGHLVLPGLVALAFISVLGSASGAAEDAMVADLLPEERRVSGYAAVRVAKNLGVSLGPPFGGLLLLGTSWNRLFAGAAALGLVTWLLAYRRLPVAGRYAPEGPPTRGSFDVVRRDRPFLVFVAAMVLAWMTYVAYDSLLAISLVRSHGLSPSTWGFLVAINPVFVTFVQLRLTRATARVPASVKLAAAMPLMGVPFVLLRFEDAAWFVVLLVVVFVVGEMLWVPTSQAVATAFAPDDLRGAYMGVFGSASQAAWAVTPFVGLQIRNGFGDAAMWEVIAAISLVAALAGASVTRIRQPLPRESLGIPHTG